METVINKSGLPPDTLQLVLQLVDRFESGQLPENDRTPDLIAAAIKGQELRAKLFQQGALVELTAV